MDRSEPRAGIFGLKTLAGLALLNVLTDKAHQCLNLIVGQRVFEGRHPATAFGDLLRNSLIRVGYGAARSERRGRNVPDLLAFTFRSMTDRAIPAEKYAGRILFLGNVTDSRTSSGEKRHRASNHYEFDESHTLSVI